MAEQLQPVPGSGGGISAASADSSSRGEDALQLPGLQEIRGQWSGGFQAYGGGGGGGASSCDFDIKGQTWQWGAYALDVLVANGSYHAEEGLQLQEVRLKPLMFNSSQEGLVTKCHAHQCIVRLFNSTEPTECRSSC